MSSMSWLMGRPSCGKSIGGSVARGRAQVKRWPGVPSGAGRRRGPSVQPWNEPPAPPTVVGVRGTEVRGEERLLGVDPLEEQPKPEPGGEQADAAPEHECPADEPEHHAEVARVAHIAVWAGRHQLVARLTAV